MRPWPVSNKDAPAPEPPRAGAATRSRRSYLVAFGAGLSVASALVHLATAAWTASRPVHLALSPPSVRELPRLDETISLDERREHAEQAAAVPADEGSALLRSYERVAVNRARSGVMLAWNAVEAAYTRDDGRSWIRVTLSKTEDRPSLPAAVVTPSGDALVAVTNERWVRIRADGVRQDLAAPFDAPVRFMVSSGTSIVAIAMDGDEPSLAFSSVDDGRSWQKGPRPPQEVWDLDLGLGQTVVVSFGWSTACGSGGKGLVTWRPGDAEWVETGHSWFGDPGDDGWSYDASTECGTDHKALCGWAPGAKTPTAVGPPVPEGAELRIATNGLETFAQFDRELYALQRGAFMRVDARAPMSLTHLTVDGKFRPVAIANGHVVRWSRAEGWRVFLPGAAPTAMHPTAQSGSP